MPNLCPTREQLEGLAPLTAQQVEWVIDVCGLAGADDNETYANWVAKFNILPPPPTGGFHPTLAAWIAANYTP